MLRQSVMGSDLSYEDMMEDRKLIDEYDASVTGSDTVRGRPCWVLELTARTPTVSYHSRKVWVDKERYVPLREDRFAKSGMLLKTTEVDSVSQRQGRWVADRVTFKDALKSGAGTEFIVDSLQLNVPIPDYLFSKASLKGRVEEREVTPAFPFSRVLAGRASSVRPRSRGRSGGSTCVPLGSAGNAPARPCILEVVGVLVALAVAEVLHQPVGALRRWSGTGSVALLSASFWPRRRRRRAALDLGAVAR